MSPSHRSGLMMAGVTALTWSILAIILKVALNYATGETIAWFRFCVAASVLILFFAISSREKLRILVRPSVLALTCAISLAINYIGYTKGVELTSPSNTQILIQMAPMMLIMSGIIFFKERPSFRQIIGFISAFTGFAFFFNDQLSQMLENREVYLKGNLWVLLAAITWAIYASLQKMLTKKWTPQEINVLIYTVSSFALIPMADLSVIPTWNWLAWTLMIVLGINTLIAYGALGYALKNAPASQVSVIITLNPLLTLLFMKILEWYQVSWIRPDTVSRLGYLGAFLVVVGVLLVIYQKSPAKKTAQA